jgi:hypothetical protein
LQRLRVEAWAELVAEEEAQVQPAASARRLVSAAAWAVALAAALARVVSPAVSGGDSAARLAERMAASWAASRTSTALTCKTPARLIAFVGKASIAQAMAATRT